VIGIEDFLGVKLRFELIDRVLERQEDRLVAIKNVTNAEEYLADHFPGFPVLPGVLMLETLVQAARLLLAEDETTAGQGPFVVAEVRNVRYGQMVRPGQSLQVEVNIRKRDEEGWEMAGVGTVQGQVAVQGRFRMVPLSRLI